MSPEFSIRPSHRFLAPFLAPLIVGLLLVALNLTAGRASADVTGQLSDARLTSGDLGVAAIFISPSADVRTPDGHGTGPDGVSDYIASLQETYPTAVFTTTDIQSVDNLLIVDWQGSVDDRVVIPGRTLITLEEGSITKVWFLNLNSVSPVSGEPYVETADAVASAPVSVYYELPYEQGRPVVVEAQGGSYATVNEDGLAVDPERAQLSASGAAPASFATDADQDER